MFYYITMKDKTKHHWGNKNSKCQVTTLKGSCVSLSNGKETTTYTSCHKAIVMRKVKPKLINETRHYKRTIGPNQCGFGLLIISIWSWFIGSKANFLVNMKQVYI